MALSIVERIRQEKNRARAIDIVYDELDSLLLSKRFDEAKALICELTQSSLSSTILISAVLVSSPWRAELGEPFQTLKAMAYTRLDSIEASSLTWRP